ncbi:hypothetical protein SAMN05444157_1590 [Frankineae bacterium MT45]|nr:hypothetical protein SAMN05444157_1590 [Frankineae bacterium MT45]
MSAARVRATDEPLFLGAIVRDRYDALWIRVSDADADPGDMSPWLRVAGGTRVSWETLEDAVGPLGVEWLGVQTASLGVEHGIPFADADPSEWTVQVLGPDDVHRLPSRGDTHALVADLIASLPIPKSADHPLARIVITPPVPRSSLKAVQS